MEGMCSVLRWKWPHWKTHEGYFVVLVMLLPIEAVRLWRLSARGKLPHLWEPLSPCPGSQKELGKNVGDCLNLSDFGGLSSHWSSVGLGLELEQDLWPSCQPDQTESFMCWLLGRKGSYHCGEVEHQNSSVDIVCPIPWMQNLCSCTSKTALLLILCELV